MTDGSVGCTTRSVAVPSSTRFQVMPLSVERKSPNVEAASTVVAVAEPAVARSITTREMRVPPPRPRSTKTSAPCCSQVSPASSDRSTPHP